MPLALFQDWTPDLKQVLVYGPAFAQLVLATIVLLKALPVWKEIRLKDIEARLADANARIVQSEALRSISENLFAVAVEQRRSSDSVKILQRVNSTKTDELEAAISESLEAQEKRISRLEKNATYPTTADATAAH